MPSESTCDQIEKEIHEVYNKESLKRPSRISCAAKRLKSSLSEVSKNAVFLGEFPSVKGIVHENENALGDKNTTPYISHTVTKRNETKVT
jgi:hypothetical protein